MNKTGGWQNKNILARIYSGPDKLRRCKEALFSLQRLTMVLSASFLLFCGCSNKGTSAEITEQPLFIINGEEVFYNDIAKEIPSGISSTDSIALFQKIVDEKIRINILKKVAEDNLIDVSYIDRKVEEYRERLLILEYLSRKKDSEKIEIKENEALKFYESHKDEMILDSPIVKGVYVKMPSTSGKLDKVKELLSQNSDDAIDRFENEYLDESYQYEYFKDKWIDWDNLLDKIPVDKNTENSLTEAGKLFETEQNGSKYYVFISEIMNAGERQPYDYAKDWIYSLLKENYLEKYEDELINSLISRAFKDKTLRIISYDPINRKTVVN